MYYGFHWGMGISMLLVFVGFLFVLYFLMKIFISDTDLKHEKPIDILKNRLAKGEITQLEFDEMKEKLESL